MTNSSFKLKKSIPEIVKMTIIIKILILTFQDFNHIKFNNNK